MGVHCTDGNWNETALAQGTRENTRYVYVRARVRSILNGRLVSECGSSEVTGYTKRAGNPRVVNRRELL